MNMKRLPSMYYSTLPDLTQTLLLKACLFENAAESLQCWNSWINQNHYNRPTFQRNSHLLPQVFDNLDFGSQRLLSLLYKKMSQAKVDDPFIRELKGYYRYTWVRNQVFRNQLEEVVKLMAADHINYVIIKGLPAIEVFYKDWGTRSVLDIDLAIHPEDWMKAFNILSANGWAAKYPNKNPKWMKGGIVHSHTLTKDDNELDLHIKFLQLPLNKLTEDSFWSGVCAYKPLHTMLKPEHQLICSFVHGMQGKDEATRTIADSVYILRSCEIDWNEVITTALSSNLVIPIIVFVEYINREQFVTIPEAIVNRISSLPITSFQFDYFKLIAKSGNPNDFNQLKLKLLRTSLMTASMTDRFRILLNNYKFEWGVRSFPEFLFALTWVIFDKSFFPKRKTENRKIPFLSSAKS